VLKIRMTKYINKEREIIVTIEKEKERKVEVSERA